MKKLLMLAFFYLVTWNDPCVASPRLCKEVNDFNSRKVFSTRSEALEFAKKLESSGDDWCVKVYKMQGINK